MFQISTFELSNHDDIYYVLKIICFIDVLTGMGANLCPCTDEEGEAVYAKDSLIAYLFVIVTYVPKSSGEFYCSKPYK